MARPPRRSRDGGQQRRRRRLHILTNYDRDIEGMNIYKLNEDDFDSDDAYSEGSEDSSSTENDSDSDDACSEDSRYSGLISSNNSRRLRRRRLVGRLGFESERFVAAGTKIFGLSSSDDHGTTVNFVFDAATRMVSATPPFQAPKKRAAFWAAGGAVYALGHRVADESQDQERRLFERLRAAPRGHDWAWEALPPPPFKRNRRLESHAVHPDGATVFLSFHWGGTFSFNGERMEWVRHGDWVLPFEGEAFYVRDLDAWVGLSSKHWGRLAACRVVDDRRGGVEQRPACKCGRELLFRHNSRRHCSASLVHMGNARSCLLETMPREDEDWSWETLGLMVPMLLRAVTFRVRYSWDGELCVVSRRSKVYKLPWHWVGQEHQLGFWI